MYCPNCRSDFDDATEVCPQCQIPLAADRAEVSGEASTVADIQPFQMIFETTDPALLESATALLDGASIPFALVNENSDDGTPAQLHVPEEYAEDVQQLLSRQSDDVADR